ncbi:hypothetical protein B9Z65_8867 [Elsinoe australis]|uniref:Uncharacterized protein n=1 Tax=Elsinoe australis TaxID=40998 RepID=A0A2P7YEZ4_9PEZI|nr:hypothetical protein B9Z65_8867 [Elsinoe australis]
MLTATAVSAVVFYFSNRNGYTTISARKPVSVGLFSCDGNVLGGALIGIGMAATGACPGSALVQAGTGGTSGIYTILGGIIGAILYVGLERTAENFKTTSEKSTTTDYIQMTDSPVQEHFIIPKITPPTITDSLEVGPATMVIIWQLFVLGVLSVLRKFLSVDNAEGVSPQVGGLFMGLSQLISILLTRSSVGVSTAYEDVARVVLSPFLATKGKLLTPATLFALGVFSASSVVNVLYMARELSPAPTMAINHIYGGAALLFGARLAKGCPSGHGISGIPTFGWASVTTIASAFASGIVFTMAKSMV